VQVPGTPLNGVAGVDPFDFVRTIAVARVLMPQSHVRLSAGRTQMSDELQALCFFAGANSIFYGEKLLTTGNPDVERDRMLLQRLGLRPERAQTAELTDDGTHQAASSTTHACEHHGACAESAVSAAGADRTADAREAESANA
jgi:biotin synthase